jgi:hypothetical protein
VSTEVLAGLREIRTVPRWRPSRADGVRHRHPGYRDDVAIRVRTTASWAWGSARAEGTVTAIHRESVTRTIKGSRIVRHGTRTDPAYEIEQDDGARVLTLRSEVEQQKSEAQSMPFCWRKRRMCWRGWSRSSGPWVKAAVV